MPAGDVLLEEGRARVAPRRAHERQRTARHVRQDPVRDLHVVARQLQLGDAGLGPQHAVRVGDAHAFAISVVRRRDVAAPARARRSRTTSLCRLVVAQAEEHRMPQATVARPVGERISATSSGRAQCVPGGTSANGANGDVRLLARDQPSACRSRSIVSSKPVPTRPT